MKRKRVLIAGASGVVGRHVAKYFQRHDWDICRLSHRPGPHPEGVYFWDPAQILATGPGHLPEHIQGCDCWINLAGASIADGRLNIRHQDRIRDSRIQATQALLTLYESISDRPRHWIQASAVGIYGHHPERVLDETMSPGDDILARICQEWESSFTKKIALLSDQTQWMIARIGLVLATDAPIYQRLRLPTRWGLAGRLGSGRQWWSWIHADDVSRIFYHFCHENWESGPYNITANEPVQQYTLSQKIAKRLKRPCWAPTPAFILRWVLGQTADHLVLASAQVTPQRLHDHGFQFKYPDIDTCLDEVVQ